MEYLSIFKELYLKKVRYLLCGGMAVNIYGIPRMTADIDLILDFEEENVRNFITVLEKFQYNPILPLSLLSLLDVANRKQMIEQKNMIVYSFQNKSKNFFTVDVLLKLPFSFDEVWQKRKTERNDDFEIILVSIEDLILMKKQTNRKQDEDDIFNLQKS